MATGVGNVLWSTLETVVLVVGTLWTVVLVALVLVTVWTAIRSRFGWRSKADLFALPHVHQPSEGSRFDPL